MLRLTLAACTLAGATCAALAQEDPAAFYQGKQVQFFTMGSPGGGYDTYTRALSSRLERVLGARVVTVNEPAAGGLVAMNRLINAKSDGLSLLLVGGEAMALATLMGEPGVNFDLMKQTWLARVSAENKVVLIGPKAPFTDFGSIVASPRPVVWAGSGKTDGNADFQSVLAYATGMKAKIIIGYKGTGGMNLAMENGEIDGRVVSDESAAMFGSASGMRVLATLARQRASQFADVPTVFEASKLSAEGEALLDWRAGVSALGRLISVTPGTPEPRVAYLRKVFADILKDPDFITELKRSQMSVTYASAEQVDALLKKVMTTLDAERLNAVKDIIINKYY